MQELLKGEYTERGRCFSPHTLPQPLPSTLAAVGLCRRAQHQKQRAKRPASCCAPPQTAAGCVLPLADVLGFETYFVKWSAVIMSGFVVAFMVAIVVALRIFNFQKR